jgi:hypothetical protein
MSLMRTAPETFGSKRDAEQWLTLTESEILRGDWSDPLKGRELFGEFGARWIAEHRVGERTREEYLSLWRHHIEPELGRIELAELSSRGANSGGSPSKGRRIPVSDVVSYRASGYALSRW